MMIQGGRGVQGGLAEGGGSREVGGGGGGGGPGVKLCFICRGPHLVRSCPQRMKNVSSAMGRMGVVPKWRGSKKGRGGWTKGANRGRSGSLSGHPLQLPPPSTIRPISSCTLETGASWE